MRASFVVALGLSAIASASAKAILYPRDYPTCANPCLANANLDGCSSTDLTCLCASSVFIDTTTQCIYDTCTSAADIKQAVETALASCKSAGEPISSTYTPTQSRSQSVSQTSTVSTGGNSTTIGSSTTSPASATGSLTSSTTSSAPTSSTSGAAATRFGSAGVPYAMLGAAVLGAIAL